MMERIAHASPRRLARIAGGLYVISIVGGLFAVGYVSAAIVIPGDAAATAHNILARDLLYRLGLAVHIVMLVCNLPLAVIFYELFKVVDSILALVVAAFLLVGTAIEGVNLLNQFAPLVLLKGGYASGLTEEQAQSLAYASLELQAIGFNLSLVFFGCYCLSTGYLVFRSSFLPRTVGVLLAIGGGCYLTNSFANFLAPGFAAGLFPYIQVPSLIGEGSFCVWLLAVGVNVPRWWKRAGAAVRNELVDPAGIGA